MRGALWLVVVVACGGDTEVLPEVTDTVAQVDPRIGTGGLGFAHGSCFVGAAVPHGLVKLGPDTNGTFGTINFLHYSGYFADDDRIRGFSHLHLHGTGATDYGVLSTMPATAFDPAKTTVAAYETRFDKADEIASAGRYEVTLANGIHVELTATQRAAVHRYSNAGAVVIDLAKTLDGGSVDAATITVGANELSGELHHLGGMSDGFGGYTVYFVARSSTPWTSHFVWSAGSPPSNAASASGTDVGAALVVDPASFELAVGISLVSVEGAWNNLDAEVPVVDFDAVHARAVDAWRAKLDSVLITGGSEAERRVFYTSLYHAFLMPSVIDDVDGTYQLAGQTPVTAVGWHQVSDLSLWDTYRTVQPLYAWLAPESARDSARSLVAFGDGLGFFPKWPLATGETGTMLGASAEIAIADAALRGIVGTGAELAWPGLRAAAMDPVAPVAGRGGRGDVEPYIQLGYVPRSVNRSVSQTTEYAHDDFALAQLAGSLGNTADRDLLLVRSHGWRGLYDPAVGFLRGKNADGTFPTTSFDPLELGDDYAEANAWHSLWMAGAHDPEGLAEILGGSDAAVAKLEEFFDSAKLDWDTADESAANFPRPYYWHGNEPDMNAAYLFAQLGRPELTREWVRWIEDEMYSDQPSGVAGNDDGGTLGAWYVLSTLGLYPIPGSDRWILGTPRFTRARVVIGGRELVITSEGRGTIELDGVTLDGPTITHAQLIGASTLSFFDAVARYEVADGIAHKFWEITLAGKTFTVRWGRLGTRGQSQAKHFSSDAEARREYDKLVTQKRKKGYRLVDGIEESAVVVATVVLSARSPELEAAVIADPSDEGALMVLGDWLQTQGDPRGELISLQCALKQAASDPKQFLERKRVADLHYKQHEPALLGPLYPLRHLFRLEWQLGYIRGAKLSLHAARAGDPDLAELLRHVVDVPAAVALQELGFGHGRRSRTYQDVIDVLGELGKPAALRSLVFGDFWRGTEEPELQTVGSLDKLGGFPQLRRLAVSGSATFGELVLPELRYLEYRSNLGEQQSSWIATCPKLEHLVIDSIPAVRVEPIRGAARLRTVRIGSAGGCIDLLARSKLLPQLETLELGNLDLADAEALIERPTAFRHLGTFRVTVRVPLDDAAAEHERILKRLRAQTTAEITVKRFNPY